MDGRQTSFIPKKPIDQGSKMGSSNTVSLFTLISILIFVVAVLSSGVVYFWGVSIQSQIVEMKAKITKAQESYEPATIERLIETSQRLKSGRDILNNHISPSLIFQALEESTLKSVRFKSFEYTYSTNGVISISMRGQARDFSTIALQSDVFANNKYIQNPILGDLALDQQGNVSFSFTANIPKDQILYNKHLDNYVNSNQ